MRRLKRLVVLMVGALVLSMMSGCANGSASPTSAEGAANTAAVGGVFQIGYANSADSDVFDKLKMDEFDKLTKDDPGFKVTFTEANMDIQKQLDQIDNFIMQKKDLIIVVPVDFAGVAPGVEAANNAGIPVICLGIESGGGDFVFVGCQNRDAGIMQAEYMAEILPENAKVLYLSGTPGLYHSVEREDGFKTTMNEKRTDVKILSTQSGEYYRSKAQQIMEDWIQAYPKFDAVVAANDQMALGAVEALKGANRIDGVYIAGVDAITDACNAIKSGEMSMSVLQSAPELARNCYETARKIKDGEQVDNGIIVPFELVTADNVDQVLE